MRDKKKTKNIKVRDLKPKKDAKGGGGGTKVNTNISTNTSSNVNQITSLT